MAAPEITLQYIMSQQFIVDAERRIVDVDSTFSNRTALMWAIENVGHVGHERVSKLVELGSNLHLKDNHFETALHYACKAKSRVSLKLILGVVATWPASDTKQRYLDDTGNGYTPLHYTCAAGHRKMTQMLLNAGADMYTRSGPKKMPAAYYAAVFGHLGIVKKFPIELLSKVYKPPGGSSKRFTSAADDMTILLGAVAGNEASVLLWLLWKKVPVDIPGAYVQPIDLAAGFADTDDAIFKMLVPYMSDKQMKSELSDWISKGRIDLFKIVMPRFDKRGLQGYPWWSWQNYLFICMYIDDVDTEETLKHKTDMAFALVERGEPLNPELYLSGTWRSSISPLTFACKQENMRLARHMLAHGADPNLGLTHKPLGMLVRQFFPRLPLKNPRWEHAWPLIKLCLDHGADPSQIIGPEYESEVSGPTYESQRYEDQGLFTCALYRAYIFRKIVLRTKEDNERAVQTEVIREFVRRGLGFTADWVLNVGDAPSRIVAGLMRARNTGLWSGAEYDPEEEIYVMDQEIVTTSCPAGCQFYGCEHTEAPIRLNTEGCKHIFCAGHVCKMIKMNRKINRERMRDLGGNQLPLKCPVCRASVKDIQFMSKIQLEHWLKTDKELKADELEEKTKVGFQNENLKAIYKVFAARKTKKERAVSNARTRLAELEEEWQQIKTNEALTAAWHVNKKKELQAAGIERRKELRRNQVRSRIELNF